MKERTNNLNLTILHKRIDSFRQGYRQNLAVLADDQQEVSNLFNDYFSHSRITELIHIYLNPSYLTRKDFLKSISFCLLSEYSCTITNLDKMIIACCPTLPQTTSLIKRLLAQKIDFTGLLELINTFINESGRGCVFIIEEFIKADKLFKDFYRQLANFAISQRQAMLVVASSCPDTAEKVLGNELNLLFGNFEKIYLNQNSFFHNFFSLEGRLRGLRASPVLISFLAGVAGSNKTYHNLIAGSLKKTSCADEEHAIVSVLESLLFKQDTFLFQKFKSEVIRLRYHFKNESSIINLLFLLASGYLRKANLQKITNSTSRDLNHKLNKLANLNYLAKHGNIYKVKDRLFSFWLKHIFKFYSVSPVFDIRRQKRLWQKEIREEISIFREDFLKSRLKKILELFRAFANDSLLIGKDRYNLPHLNNVKIFSYPEEDFHLLVGEGKKIIFAGIKERLTDDNDIFEFIKKGSNIKGKNVQKIFISLDDLTDTAKLVAKNKKIALWDKHKLNCLLDIYNKPNFLQCP